MSGKFVLSIAAAILILAGCTYEIRKPTEVCPGKESIAEALAALQSNSQNIVPLWAKGHCLLQYYAEKKKHKENLTVRVLVNPPVEIYLQGDASIVPKAIVLGSNEQEFWLSIRPKEISTYWWGKWSEQDSYEKLIINPKTLLEALGVTRVNMDEDWSLSNEGAFDILTRRDRGAIIKKIHIFSCDYRVSKIEYFDSDGQAVAFTELNKYKEVSEGFFVPALIKVTTPGRNNPENSFSITLNLKSVKPATEKQQNFPFNRPQPRGLKHLYRIVDGRWIEQQQ
ncbi:MAG: hypothetical protein ACYTFW_02885 [Planctomycetota bacterium]|jgi:hypothetical protein